MKHLVTWLFLLMLLPCSTGPVEAVSLKHKHAVDLIDEAEAILVGSVTDVLSVPTAESDFAFTFVTFKIEHALKGGSQGESLTLRLIGGQIWEDTIQIAGVPQFSVGQRHLLFVADNGQAAVPLVGWFQGSLVFARDPDTGEDVLLDHEGHGIAGIANNDWQPANLRLTERGFVREQPDPGVIVLEQFDIEVEVVAEPPLAPPAAASKLLDQVANLVNERSDRVGVRAPATVRSASILEVPSSVRFHATSSAAMGGAQ